MVVFRSDPCGVTCLLVTYMAILYADYVVVCQLVIPTMSETLWGSVNVVLFNTILFLLVVSHVRAVFSDPGIVPLPKTGLDFSDHHVNQRYQEKGNNDWTVCVKCDTYRPPRAHHCRICRRCIKRMDHHCPWINNCVGEYNQKFFIQFLFYVGMAALYAIVLAIIAWVKDPFGPNFEIRHTRIIHSIVLVIECILFGLFVIAIGCDQLQAIFTDETAVEQIQRRGSHRPKRPRMELLTEVFGNGPKFLWLCPYQFGSHDHRPILDV